MAAKTNRKLHAFKVGFWARLTIIGILLYVGIDVILAFLRPDISLLHNAESDYGRGPYYWVMDINFLLRCLLSLALVRALYMQFPKNKLLRPVRFCLVLWAIASGLLEFFADNPPGYVQLKSGNIHLLLAFIAFVAVTVAMVAVWRQLPLLDFSRTIGRIIISLTLISIISLLLLGRAGARPQGLGGLYERLFLGSVLLWEGVVAYAIQLDWT